MVIVVVRLILRFNSPARKCICIPHWWHLRASATIFALLCKTTASSPQPMPCLHIAAAPICMLPLWVKDLVQDFEGRLPEVAPAIVERGYLQLLVLAVFCMVVVPMLHQPAL